MKKPLPIYPVLLAAFPTVAIYMLNLAMVPLRDVWRPLGASLVIGLALFALAAAVTRSLVKAAALGALLIILFFSYGPLATLTDPLSIQVADAIALVGSTALILRSRSDFAFFTKIANFGAVVLLTLPIVQILMRRPPGRPQPTLAVSLPINAKPSSIGERPDIFFIIVDGYGRADQLKKAIGFSNDAFVNGLRARGFFVADASHSNYCQTQLSLAATLNLSFLQEFPAVFPSASEDRWELTKAMDRSYAAAYLKNLGYTYISVTSGFDEVAFDSADIVYSHPMALTMIESTVLQLTPITLADTPLKGQFDRRRYVLNGALDNLAALGKPAGRPRFIVAHILAPHPPFVFDADGGPVRQKMPFGFWDGSHYMSMKGSPKLYRDGYSGQIAYLNKRLSEMCDAILASSGKVKPVIFIEGDHGSKVGLEQDRIEKTDLRECFANLFAVYGPESLKARLYPSITSVNTFRTAFDAIFGEKLPLLPDRSFYSPFSKPYRFTEVTDQIR